MSRLDVTHVSVLLLVYHILPIISASLNRGAPLVWLTQYCNEGLKYAYFPK